MISKWYPFLIILSDFLVKLFSKAQSDARLDPNYEAALTLVCHIFTIPPSQLIIMGPLQLAIHVVQNRRAGEQKSLWDKTNKEN